MYDRVEVGFEDVLSVPVGMDVFLVGHGLMSLSVSFATCYLLGQITCFDYSSLIYRLLAVPYRLLNPSYETMMGKGTGIRDHSCCSPSIESYFSSLPVVIFPSDFHCSRHDCTYLR